MALLPTILALATACAVASPSITQLGSAIVTVALSPDPPTVGSNTVTVQVTGVQASKLDSTTVRYATLMPSMNMSGPSGVASRVSGSTNQWRFQVELGTATTWTLQVQLSGGISGSVSRSFVTSSAGSSSDAMAGMSASGDNAAWRNAIFVLIGVLFIGALVLRRDRRPLTISIVGLAVLVVVGLAYAQSRYGSSSTGMSSMQGTAGVAPIPVTFARVGGPADTSAIQAPANVQPYLVQNIVARAAGVLTGFNAYTGDRLEAGDVVARLEEPELQSNARAAEAAAQAARNQRTSAQDDIVSMQADVAAQREKVRYWNAEISRERSLLNAGAVSVQEYQDERAQAATARSAYRSALAKVSGAKALARAAQAQVEQATAGAQSQNILAGYANVVVPSNSVVMKRLVDPGVYVQPGTPILQVAVVNRLRVQAQVAQQNLAGIDIGTPVDVMLGDGRVLHSTVSSLSPVVDPN
ncbi:MAG: efflux RND transporter periplasmic adaptor subunit, partial [Vulcanimicrobiaceae bacterium]